MSKIIICNSADSCVYEQIVELSTEQETELAKTIAIEVDGYSRSNNTKEEA